MTSEISILAGILVLMVFLAARGVVLWLAILIASIFLSLALRFDFPLLAGDFWKVLIDPNFIELTIVVLQIYLFSALLKSTKRMEKMTSYLSSKLQNPILILFSFPALVGLIPMPGGAMFTAPITDEFGSIIKLSNEDKVFSNYWFRHCWELNFPLYPGIILCSGLAHISPTSLSFILLPLALTAFFSGFILFYFRSYFLTNNPGTEKTIENMPLSEKNTESWIVLWPILAVIFVAGAKISLILGLSSIIIVLAIQEKIKGRDFLHSCLESVNLPIMALIYSVFLLGQVLATTEVLSNLSFLLINAGLPIWLLSFVLPFALGLITGVTTGFVGIVFPILLPLWKENTALFLQFAYASGLAGVFLSPSHLCLTLTQEYFGANLWGVIKLLLFPVCAVILASAIRLAPVIF
ncbi:MAG: DUF401 family protein [Candidatus Riflebacteria bacterium]|nr:DUF401 family protein [Candidatus Riflebacteria bacterium]